MDRLENLLSDRMGPVEPEGFATTTARATGDNNRHVKQNRAAEDMRETGLLQQEGSLPAPAPALMGHRGPGFTPAPKKAFDIKIDSPQIRDEPQRGRATTQGRARAQSTPPTSWAMARPDVTHTFTLVQPPETSIARLNL